MILPGGEINVPMFIIICQYIVKSMEKQLFL